MVFCISVLCSIVFVFKIIKKNLCRDARPIGGSVIINSVSTADLSYTAEERKVKAFKIHELYKLIDLPNDAGQAANVRIHILCSPRVRKQYYWFQKRMGVI